MTKNPELPVERGTRERRWAVISEDGRHIWLGRDRDPEKAELATIQMKLKAQGSVAWLVVTEGAYYDDASEMTLLMVRPLAGLGDWESAAAAFRNRRHEAIAQV